MRPGAPGDVGGEPACRRGSVRRSPGGVAIHLSGLPGDIGRAARPLLGLAPGGVYRAARVAPGAGALLPHRFTLTRPSLALRSGGLLSVALSCGSPRLAVSQHPALWSPDLPQPPELPRTHRGHPAGSPRPFSHVARRLRPLEGRPSSASSPASPDGIANTLLERYTVNRQQVTLRGRRNRSC
jgi:hypothetical protein